jgi:hypothetical protein
MTKQPDQGWRDFVLNSLPKMEATSTAGTAGFTPAPANPQPFSTGFPSPPSFDVIERLPEDRKDLLRKLHQRRADAHAVIPEFEAVREASMSKIEAANALTRLTSHAQDGGFGLKPEDRRVVVAKRVSTRRPTI